MPPTPDARGRGGRGERPTRRRLDASDALSLLVSFPLDACAPTGVEVPTAAATTARRRPFRLPTNHERHLLSEHAMATPPPLGSGLIPTPKGLRFVLPACASDLKAHGRRIFLHMLSEDRPIDDWLGGMEECKWQQRAY